MWIHTTIIKSTKTAGELLTTNDDDNTKFRVGEESSV
jgi:hypothetical protein